MGSASGVEVEIELQNLLPGLEDIYTDMKSKLPAMTFRVGEEHY